MNYKIFTLSTSVRKEWCAVKLVWPRSKDFVVADWIKPLQIIWKVTGNIRLNKLLLPGLLDGKCNQESIAYILQAKFYQQRIEMLGS